MRFGAFLRTNHLKMRTRCWKHPNYSQWLLLFSRSGSRALVKQKGTVCWPGFTSQPSSQETWPNLNSHLCACEHRGGSLQRRRRHVARAAGKDGPQQAEGTSVWPAPVLQSRAASDTSLRVAPKENGLKAFIHPFTPLTQTINSKLGMHLFHLELSQGLKERKFADSREKPI